MADTGDHKESTGDLVTNNLVEKEGNIPTEREENNLTKRAENSLQTNEGEGILLKQRARLFRFENSTREWKACSTGEVQLLQHKESKKVRVLIHLDKTLAVFANHYITGDMRLLPNIGSDRSWVWNVAKDVSGGEPTAEHFAVRFANKNIADEFKLVFENAQASASAYTQHPVPSGKYSQNLS
ncbi:hypothetical protein FRC09_003672 [Ceratobasidium sp. 395]|nr:hypothetical protein FRC09_003672 [Ceratobasidium sp. 395]